jgi:hypothetical protein
VAIATTVSQSTRNTFFPFFLPLLPSYLLHELRQPMIAFWIYVAIVFSC